MAIALGHPEHGYYRKVDPLGVAGDFITAPEISQIFGEIFGLWAAVLWQQAGAPAAFRLIELGPGRGTLMADALRAANGVAGFSDSIAVHLVETSPVLRQKQRAALPDTAIEWHDSLADVPPGPAIVIANEFFDALPTDQYVLTAEGWRERRVDIDAEGGALVFVVSEAPPDPGVIPPALAGTPLGSIFEHSPNREAAARTLGHRLVADGGAALIVDYGHALSGAGDTLQAVHNHHPHDVLRDTGQADLTTHVDFAALSDAARAVGAQSWGPVPQGAFLAALGAEQRTEALAASATPGQAAALRTGLKRLIAADGMGTLFKIMALTGPGTPPPAGFEFKGDRAAR